MEFRRGRFSDPWIDKVSVHCILYLFTAPRMAWDEMLSLEQAAKNGDADRFAVLWDQGGRGYWSDKENQTRLWQLVESCASGGSPEIAKRLRSLDLDARTASFAIISALGCGRREFAEEMSKRYGKGADAALLSLAVICNNAGSTVRGVVARAIERGLGPSEQVDGEFGPLGMADILAGLETSIRMGILENVVAIADVAGDRFEPADWGRARTKAKRAGSAHGEIYAFISSRANACKERSAMDRLVPNPAEGAGSGPSNRVRKGL